MKVDKYVASLDTIGKKDLKEEEFYKGISLIKAKKYDKALRLFKKLDPCKEVHLNLGSIYRELDKFPEAALEFKKAITSPYWNGSNGKEPDAEALQGLGSMIYDAEGNDDLAMEYFLAAYTLDRNLVSAGWNFGVTGIRQYCSGKTIDLAKMWKFYEIRFQNGIKMYAHKEHMGWKVGEYHLDQDIVIIGDQGYGDFFMFSRYIPFLEKYFRKVYINPRPGMESLYKNIYTKDCDAKYYIPVCNLGQLINYIPNGEWLEGGKKENGEFAIGCVWQGNKAYGHDKWRSCDVKYFKELKGKKYSFNIRKVGFENLECKTWADTIKNLEKVDLVITVDTAIAHLCGCLGKECWVLMPLHFSDYRWGDKTMGEKNLWYSSVKVIRNYGSWDKVFDEVKERLSGRSTNI